MRRRLVYGDAALQDLASILRRIASESGSASLGRRFVAEIEARCARLASLPGTLGRARPELRADIRSIAFKSYVIFFRYHNDVVEIVDILHGHRDIDAFFGADDF